MQGSVRTSIIDNDALRLKSDLFEGRVKPAKKFKEVGKSKAKAFEKWFRQNANSAFQMQHQQLQRRQQRQGQSGGQQPQQPEQPTSPPQQPQNVAPWIAAFALAAYIKGMEMANKEFGTPVIPPEDIRPTILNEEPFLSRFKDLARKHRDEIQGLIERVTNKVRRKVSEGLQSEKSRRTIAKWVNERIRKVGVKDGRLIADTETIRTINDAALSLYDEGGIERVSATVHWTTRQDDRVCDYCKEHSGEYRIENAYGKLPAHIGGRCWWRPST